MFAPDRKYTTSFENLPIGHFPHIVLIFISLAIVCGERHNVCMYEVSPEIHPLPLPERPSMVTLLCAK